MSTKEGPPARVLSIAVWSARRGGIGVRRAADDVAVGVRKGVEVAAGGESGADIDAAVNWPPSRVPLEEALGQRPALAFGAGGEVIVHLVEQHAAAGVENGGADEDDDERRGRPRTKG